jgi:hypothetical protein
LLSNINGCFCFKLSLFLKTTILYFFFFGEWRWTALAKCLRATSWPWLSVAGRLIFYQLRR